MNPSPSPPQEAEHIRHQQLTPESPRPQNVPSPANIPILELQMDPNFHESSHNNGISTPAPQYASHSQTPNPFASTPHYIDPSTAANHQQHVGVQGTGGAATGYAQSAAYGDSSGTQAQGTSSIQHFSAQQQSRAASSNDATQSQPPSQNVHSAYPYAHDNAYAAQQASAQSVPGSHYQSEGNGATSVDVQALLDSLTPSVQHAQSAQYAAAQMSPQTAQAQPNASASQSGLPPRPPAQEYPANANYNPNDDIRSFHPHSQQVPNTLQQTGNGQPQHLNVLGQSYAPMSQGGAQSAQSPTGQGNAPKRQAGQRSETPDDEDIRWPPEVNKKYEEFLDQERKFVTEGQWDQFPMGSRLFIGKTITIFA
jgi:hypothetical protein